MSSTVKGVSFADRPKTTSAPEKKHQKFHSGTINHVQAKLLKASIPVIPEKGQKLDSSKITTPPSTPRPPTPLTVPKENK